MKCSSCGGTMIYDVGKHGLVCDHCGAVQVLPGPGEQSGAEETDMGSAIKRANTDWGAAKTLVTCQSCGAQLFCDDDKMSGLCPFCGSAVVLTLENANFGIAPSAIIPFSVTKEQVEERFYKWNKFAFWSPEKFRTGKALGNLTPVYVPYWTFDADAETTYSGRFGDIQDYQDGTKTIWTNGSGTVKTHINDYCVCASRKFANDKLLNQVVCFTADEMVPYQPEYLAGMTAEKYTIGIDEAWNSVQEGPLKKMALDAACRNEHADCSDNVSVSTQYSNITYKCVLVPVWLTGCKFGGKVYNVVAGGHNERGNCGRPVSIAKIALLIGLILLLFNIGNISFLVMMIVSMLTQGG